LVNFYKGLKKNGDNPKSRHEFGLFLQKKDNNRIVKKFLQRVTEKGGQSERWDFSSRFWRKSVVIVKGGNFSNGLQGKSGYGKGVDFIQALAGKTQQW